MTTQVFPPSSEEHRGWEGLSDWTQLATERAHGVVLPAPPSTSQDWGRPTAAPSQWEMISPTSASQTERSLCRAAPGYCAGVRSSSHSPFNRHSTSFQAIKKQQPGSEAAISQRTAPQLSETQLPLCWSPLTLHFKHWLKELCFLQLRFWGFFGGTAGRECGEEWVKGESKSEYREMQRHAE